VFVVAVVTATVVVIPSPAGPGILALSAIRKYSLATDACTRGSGAALILVIRASRIVASVSVFVTVYV